MFLDALLDLLIPSRCAACGARGEPCCARCGGVWGAVREVARVPTAGLVRVFSLARYTGVGRRLLIAYKERGRRDLAPALGTALAEALVVLPLRATGAGTVSASVPQLAEQGTGTGSTRQPPDRPRVADDAVAYGQPGLVRAVGTTFVRLPPDEARSAVFAHRPPGLTRAASHNQPSDLAQSAGPPPGTRKICLVPAPSRPAASRVRGGPHVERLAEAAAKVLSARGFEVAVAPALELAGSARDAVGLGHAQRAANLAGRLRFREAGRPPPGFPVVVLDDVVTTGATAAACVRVLAAEGIAVSAVLTLLTAG